MKIIIVDDDRLVALSLKTILESSPDVEVTATGADGKEALSLYRRHQPNILLMDIQMKPMSGIEAGRILLSEFPDARILYLTTFSDNEYIMEALQLGAKGYILKQDFESILPALTAVMSGQSVFGGEIVSKLPALFNHKAEFSYQEHGITEKEFQIIEQIALGKSNKEIADSLFLGEGTVRNYLSSILTKLNLRDRTQLAVFYYQNK